MELVFVRHGRPVIEINTDKVANPGLSELGLWQVERLTTWLSHEPFDAVVASPKQRAIDTVAPTATLLGLDVTIVEDLDEIDRRATTYYPTELLKTEGGAYWEKVQAQDWAGAGWDPPEEFGQRVVTAFESLVAASPGERVLVGCHGGTIGVIVRHILEAKARMDFGIEYASITRVQIEGDNRRLRSLNELGQFDADRIGWHGPMRDGYGRIAP